MRTKAIHAVVFSAILLSFAFNESKAITYTTSGPPGKWFVNGHYYQTWHFANYSSGYKFEDLENFVAGLTHNGIQGHLATYTSQAEFNNGLGSSEKGFIGAIGDNTSTGYVWSAGPDSGIPVSIYGQFIPTNHTGCPPYNRLVVTNTLWGGAGNQIGCYGNRITGYNFTVEYSPEDPIPVEETTWGRIKILFR